VVCRQRLAKGAQSQRPHGIPLFLQAFLRTFYVSPAHTISQVILVSDPCSPVFCYSQPVWGLQDQNCTRQHLAASCGWVCARRGIGCVICTYTGQMSIHGLSQANAHARLAGQTAAPTAAAAQTLNRRLCCMDAQLHPYPHDWIYKNDSTIRRHPAQRDELHAGTDLPVAGKHSAS
jgi:hypothetical protein